MRHTAEGIVMRIDKSPVIADCQGDNAVLRIEAIVIVIFVIVIRTPHNDETYDSYCDYCAKSNQIIPCFSLLCSAWERII